MAFNSSFLSSLVGFLLLLLGKPTDLLTFGNLDFFFSWVFFFSLLLAYNVSVQYQNRVFFRAENTLQIFTGFKKELENLLYSLTFR